MFNSKLVTTNLWNVEKWCNANTERLTEDLRKWENKKYWVQGHIFWVPSEQKSGPFSEQSERIEVLTTDSKWLSYEIQEKKKSKMIHLPWPLCRINPSIFKTQFHYLILARTQKSRLSSPRVHIHQCRLVDYWWARAHPFSPHHHSNQAIRRQRNQRGP